MATAKDTQIFKPSMTPETKTVSLHTVLYGLISYTQARTNKTMEVQYSVYAIMPLLVFVNNQTKKRPENYISSHKHQPKPATTSHYNEQAYEYLVLACFVETPDLQKM